MNATDPTQKSHILEENEYIYFGGIMHILVETGIFYVENNCTDVSGVINHFGQILHGTPNYGVPSKFVFSYMEMGSWGILWPKTHLEHPETVVLGVN